MDHHARCNAMKCPVSSYTRCVPTLMRRLTVSTPPQPAIHHYCLVTHHHSAKQQPVATPVCAPHRRHTPRQPPRHCRNQADTLPTAALPRQLQRSGGGGVARTPAGPCPSWLRGPRLGGAAGCRARAAPTSLIVDPVVSVKSGGDRSTGRWVRGGGKARAKTTAKRGAEKPPRAAGRPLRIQGCRSRLGSRPRRDSHPSRAPGQPAYLPNLVSSNFGDLTPKPCDFLVEYFSLHVLVSTNVLGFFPLNFNERPTSRSLKRAKNPNGSLITTKIRSLARGHQRGRLSCRCASPGRVVSTYFTKSMSMCAPVFTMPGACPGVPSEALQWPFWWREGAGCLSVHEGCRHASLHGAHARYMWHCGGLGLDSMQCPCIPVGQCRPGGKQAWAWLTSYLTCSQSGSSDCSQAVENCDKLQ